MERALRESEAIETESLCVLAGALLGRLSLCLDGKHRADRCLRVEHSRLCARAGQWGQPVRRLLGRCARGEEEPFLQPLPP